MKRLIFTLLLLTGCGIETKLPEYDEVYIKQPVDKIENTQ